MGGGASRMSSRESALTAKQEAAVQAFLEGASKAQAYRLAGYKVVGMKPATLHRTAHALFDNPKVSARVAELQAAHLERHEITVDSSKLREKWHWKRRRHLPRFRPRWARPGSWASSSIAASTPGQMASRLFRSRGLLEMSLARS